MSEHEFDNYLALLSRLLRIAPQQREQVAKEFRTHMEDRLDDLLARGMSRDKAVKLALEEFGDAAGLAAQLAQISTIRKRRWYMKVSAFSVAGLAAAVLLAIALWPDSGRLPSTPQAIAQQPAKRGMSKGRAAAADKTLEQKLADRITVDFLDTPLSEVFEFVGAKNQIQIYINRRSLGDESIMLDAPITMSLTDVKVETVLDLALEQVSDQLAYMERDGVLIISTVTALEGATEVRVYNCRDLLAFSSPQPGMMMPGMMMPGMMGGGMGMGSGMTPAPSGSPAHSRGPSNAFPPGDGAGSAPDSPPSAPPSGEGVPRLPLPGAPSTNPTDDPEGAAPTGEDHPDPFKSSSAVDRWNERAILAQISGMMGPGMGPMGGGGFPMNPGRSRPEPATDHERKAARLMDLIITAVDPGSWQDTGGFGTISEYEGLIVVNHNARTHKKIENVLSMLRQSAGMPENGVMPGMSGMMMGGMGMMGMGPAAASGGFSSGPPTGANPSDPRAPLQPPNRPGPRRNSP